MMEFYAIHPQSVMILGKPADREHETPLRIV